MPDNAVVMEYREAAAEAQARGDTQAGNAAYAAELRALSDAQDTGQDTSAVSLDDTGETPAGDEKTEEPEDTQFPQHVPVPVEITDRVYGQFREAFGDNDAENLQRLWGNNAFQNEQIVRAVIRDHPQLDRIYVEHQTENGLSFEGVAQVLRYVQSGESESAFLKEHPEIENIYNDHSDEQDNLSITGCYRLLHYLGNKSGYRHTYRGKQR